MKPEQVFARFPRLETERLILRALRAEDEQAVFALFSDPRVTRYYDLDTFQERRQARELIAHFQNRFANQVGLRWAIAHRQEPDALLGTCGYNIWIRPARRAVLGYDLLPAHWGKGLMREALSAVLAYGFANMELNRVEALTFPENQASSRLLEKLGFRQEGLLRQYQFLKGRFVDMALCALLAEEHANAF